MRENRPSGSEGGETGKPVFPTSIIRMSLRDESSVHELPSDGVLLRWSSASIPLIVWRFLRHRDEC